MAWFSRKIAAAIDVPPPRNVSYDEFIALCFLQMRGRDFAGQRDITFDIMTSLMPPGGDAVFRTLFPKNAFSLELNATVTKIVFACRADGCPRDDGERPERAFGITGT